MRTHAGVAYVVPTGIGTTRQFHTFLQTDPDAPPAAGAGWLSRLKGWFAGNKPTWAQHMSAHVLLDADAAIQARVDTNRCACACVDAVDGAAVAAEAALPARRRQPLTPCCCRCAGTGTAWHPPPTTRHPPTRAVNGRVYMPAAADAGPAAFMRWLKEYGGGGPPVAKLKDPFVGHTPTGAWREPVTVAVGVVCVVVHRSKPR
jgi:hypothetical protein